jgi:hypothetical protein
MSKLDVGLIALDLDDTLLDKDRNISDKNVEALRKAAELGIYVVLCSGPQKTQFFPMCAAWRLPVCRQAAT